MSVQKVGDFKLKAKERRLQAMKITLPIVLGRMTVLHFKKGFTNGGGQTDASKNGWQKRAKETTRSLGRKILVDTEKLRNDIKPMKTKFNNIVVSAGNHYQTKKYAAIHNEGGRGLAWGKHPFTMPKREFIGKSTELERKIMDAIHNATRKAIK